MNPSMTPTINSKTPPRYPSPEAQDALEFVHSEISKFVRFRATCDFINYLTALSGFAASNMVPLVAYTLILKTFKVDLNKHIDALIRSQASKQNLHPIDVDGILQTNFDLEYKMQQVMRAFEGKPDSKIKEELTNLQVFVQGVVYNCPFNLG